MRTILLGRPIAAEEALSCGLLCDLVDDGDLLQHAINVGAGLGERGPEALQFAKGRRVLECGNELRTCDVGRRPEEGKGDQRLVREDVEDIVAKESPFGSELLELVGIAKCVVERAVMRQIAKLGASSIAVVFLRTDGFIVAMPVAAPRLSLRPRRTSVGASSTSRSAKT